MPIAEGILTQHMAAHVVAMNLVAPAVVIMLPAPSRRLASGAGLAAATVVQTGLLWGWHLPSVLAGAFENPSTMVAMHASLFIAALWFWSIVVEDVRRANWRPIAALLVTGKLFCLLGVLLTFAPRALYWQLALLQSCFGAYSSPLADQQLAGLLMLAACPVVFVGAAILAANRWLRGVQAAPGWRPAGEPA